MSVELKNLNLTSGKPVTLQQIQSGIQYLKQHNRLDELVTFDIPEMYAGKAYDTSYFAKKIRMFIGIVSPKGGMEYGYVAGGNIQLPQTKISSGVMAHNHAKRKGDTCNMSIAESTTEFITNNSREPVAVGAILAELARSMQSFHEKNKKLFESKVKQHGMFNSPLGASKTNPNENYISIRINLETPPRTPGSKGAPQATFNTPVKTDIYRVVKTPTGFKPEPYLVAGKKLTYGIIHEHVNWGAIVSGIFSLSLSVSQMGCTFSFQMRNMVLKTNLYKGPDIQSVVGNVDMSAFADENVDDASAEAVTEGVSALTLTTPDTPAQIEAPYADSAQATQITNMVAANAADDDEFQ